jgi:hypothetical protein
VHALVWLAPLLRRAFLWWQEAVNGFVLVEARRAERTFVFRCTHFDRSDALVRQLRVPARHVPRLPARAALPAAPELLPGCGYRPLARNAAALRRALDARPLSAEQRERLARQLFLE